jgi:hypothetical protein
MASPYEYTPNQPTIDSQIAGQFRKAGSRLGLDLEGLFKDDGEGTATLQGDFAPNLQMETTTRGRGYGATMKPQQKDPVTTTFSLGMPSGGASVINNFNPVNNNTVTATSGGGGGGGGGYVPPQKKIYQGIAGGIIADRFQPQYGGTGFGMGDLERAIADDYDIDSIKTYLKGFSGQIGPKAAEALGIKPRGFMKTAARAAQLEGDGTNIGLAGVQRMAKSLGISQQEAARQARASGINLGQKAAALLGGGGGGGGGNAGRTVQSVAASPATAFSSGGSIGLQGLQNTAAAQGISLQAAKAQAQAAGLNLGAKAAAI